MILRQYRHTEPAIALSYLIGCGGQSAGAVIDPVEPPEFYREEARAAGLKIKHVIDTHVHADHLSTGKALAAAAGAEYLLHADSGARFPFRGVRDGDSLELGNVLIRVWHVPGHTPEHIALIVSDRTRADEPWVVFTGHTLMVGDMGRTELDGDPAEGARALFESARRLRELPAHVQVLPGAFAGSVCGRGLSGVPFSTIGFEQMHNNAFRVSESDEFVALMLREIPPRPDRAAEIRAENMGFLSPVAAARKSKRTMASEAFPPNVAVNQKATVLGLRENWRQFWLLVLVNAFVGAMVGLERTVLPLLAEQEFGVASRSAALSFIATFGVVKALTNVVAGRLGDEWGRKRILVVGWLFALPVPLMVMWAPSWGWIIAANVLLGVNQGLAWSTTVIMKIDLVGPQRRGLAMGLNEFAGYLAVATAALASGEIAVRNGLRPEPFYLGIAAAVMGLSLTLLFVRDTAAHVEYEIALRENNRQAGEPATTTLSGRELFMRSTWRDPALSSASHAGLVNNLNDGMAWGLFPILFAAAGLTLREIGILIFIYPATWGISQLWTGALSDRVGRKRLIVSGMMLQGAALVGVALSHQMQAWIIASAMLGVGTAMVYPTLLAAIGDVAHPSWRGNAVGIYRFWRDLGYAVGAVVAGILADAWGMGQAIASIGVLTAATGILVAARMPETLTVDLRRQPPQRDSRR
ncbi:MAG: MFS transporter [Gemmatimonadaceae bacterium]